MNRQALLSACGFLVGYGTHLLRVAPMPAASLQQQADVVIPAVSPPAQRRWIEVVSVSRQDLLQDFVCGGRANAAFREFLPRFLDFGGQAQAALVDQAAAQNSDQGLLLVWRQLVSRLQYFPKGH